MKPSWRLNAGTANAPKTAATQGACCTSTSYAALTSLNFASATALAVASGCLSGCHCSSVTTRAGRRSRRRNVVVASSWPPTWHIVNLAYPAQGRYAVPTEMSCVPAPQAAGAMPLAESQMDKIRCGGRNDAHVFVIGAALPAWRPCGKQPSRNACAAERLRTTPGQRGAAQWLQVQQAQQIPMAVNSSSE